MRACAPKDALSRLRCIAQKASPGLGLSCLMLFRALGPMLQRTDVDLLILAWRHNCPTKISAMAV